MPEYRCSAQSALIHSSCCRGAHCCAVATALGERLLRSLSAPQLQGLGDEHQSQYCRCPGRHLRPHLYISTCNCSRLHTTTEGCGAPPSYADSRQNAARRRFVTAAAHSCAAALVTVTVCTMGGRALMQCFMHELHMQRCHASVAHVMVQRGAAQAASGSAQLCNCSCTAWQVFCFVLSSRGTSSTKHTVYSSLNLQTQYRAPRCCDYTRRLICDSQCDTLLYFGFLCY